MNGFKNIYSPAACRLALNYFVCSLYCSFSSRSFPLLIPRESKHAYIQQSWLLFLGGRSIFWATWKSYQNSSLQGQVKRPHPKVECSCYFCHLSHKSPYKTINLNVSNIPTQYNPNKYFQYFPTIIQVKYQISIPLDYTGLECLILKLPV